MTEKENVRQEKIRKRLEDVKGILSNFKNIESCKNLVLAMESAEIQLCNCELEFNDTEVTNKLDIIFSKKIIELMDKMSIADKLAYIFLRDKAEILMRDLKDKISLERRLLSLTGDGLEFFNKNFKAIKKREYKPDPKLDTEMELRGLSMISQLLEVQDELHEIVNRAKCSYRFIITSDLNSLGLEAEVG